MSLNNVKENERDFSFSLIFRLFILSRINDFNCKINFIFILEGSRATICGKLAKYDNF